ncbi:MAG: hypothetical protein LAN59_11985 [Acidobacteriia bacterium]|nr:hypothetical protein [Terriglobia bacterium]
MSARAQESSGVAGSGRVQEIDGVAARIEDDILTESEVRELGAFQLLVEGHAKPRAERIRELADQWIVRGEARAAQYRQPSSEDVDRAWAQFTAHFASPEEFQKRRTAAQLSEPAIRRLLAEQLYLSRFLDYRFRPAAQVEQKQIEAYYRDEFVPRLQAGGQAVPAIEAVEDTIREVLVQRAISARATQWLDDTRNRVKIDIVPEGDRP